MPRWKVELYDPISKHAIIVRLDAVSAEQAATLGRTHVIIRKRRSTLRGRAVDYRVEHVGLLRSRAAVEGGTA